MPSALHETLTAMFRHRPLLAAELLGDALGVPLPDFEQAQLDPTEFTELVPTEYRADAVVVLTGSEGPALAVVVEVQLRRDAAKRFSWPVYVTTLRARLRCPAVVLVVCDDASIAQWCGVRIDLGPGSAVTPLVVGPDRVPVVTDPARASEDPELAVLSMRVHGAEIGEKTW